MLWPSFCGAFYQALSPMIADETAVNIFTETREIPGSPKAVTMYGTPGLDLFAETPTTGCRGSFTQDGRTWTVIGDTLYEVDVAGGGYVSIGTIHNDGFPVSFTSNGRGGDQLGIVGGDELHVLNLRTGVYSTVTLPFSGPVMIVFQDGYGLINQANSPIVWYSALEDLTSWDALDFVARSGTSDNLVGLAVSRDRIWFIGTSTTTLFYDEGDADTPFIPYPGTAAQVGGVSPWLIQVYQDAVYWVGASPGALRQVFRATDPTPVVISTPPIDLFLQQCDSMVLATSDIYEQGGHPFFLITAPESQTDICTYAYDMREQMWHARADWNATTGRYQPWRVRGLTSASGLIIGGDRNTGKLYVLNLATYTNDGDILRRERTAPYLSAENQWLFLDQIELGIGRVQAGLANPLPPPVGPVITALIPDEGPTGTAFEIVGYNFGVYQGSSIATLNGAILTVTSWSATSIFTSVPSGATTGPVQVTVNGIPSNEVTFTITFDDPDFVVTIDDEGYAYNLEVAEITASPTGAEAIARHPELVFTWATTTEPASFGADVVVYLHGATFCFYAEATTGDLTGGSEPNWASAPNVNDTLSDGDLTWTNCGLWSAFPPTPVTWQAMTGYTMPAFILPTAPNATVYTPYGDFTSGASEPDWTLLYGDYVGDGSGYLMNASAPQFVFQDAVLETVISIPSAQTSKTYYGWWSSLDETLTYEVYIVDSTTGVVDGGFRVDDTTDMGYNHVALLSQSLSQSASAVYGLIYRAGLISGTSPMYVVAIDTATQTPTYVSVNSAESLNKVVNQTRPAYVDGVLYFFYSTSTSTTIPSLIQPRLRGIDVATGSYTAFDLDLSAVMVANESVFLLLPMPNGTQILMVSYINGISTYLRVITIATMAVESTTVINIATVDTYDGQCLDNTHLWSMDSTGTLQQVVIATGAVAQTISYAGQIGTSVGMSLLVTP